MEIGTGSGLISLCSLRAGARNVVATDVNPNAIECARANAEKLRVSERFEVRWVDPKNAKAFSVIKPHERFDLIISNPPGKMENQLASTNTRSTIRNSN